MHMQARWHVGHTSCHITWHADAATTWRVQPPSLPCHSRLCPWASTRPTTLAGLQTVAGVCMPGPVPQAARPLHHRHQTLRQAWGHCSDGMPDSRTHAAGMALHCSTWLMPASQPACGSSRRTSPEGACRSQRWRRRRSARCPWPAPAPGVAGRDQTAAWQLWVCQFMNVCTRMVHAAAVKKAQGRQPRSHCCVLSVIRVQEHRVSMRMQAMLACLPGRLSCRTGQACLVPFTLMTRCTNVNHHGRVNACSMMHACTR